MRRARSSSDSHRIWLLEKRRLAAALSLATMAGVGVVVSLAAIRPRTDHITIWDEVGGAPPLVADQP